MRAKSINEKNIAFCFDFDDTLIKTNAKLHIYHRGKYFKSLSAEEYNFFEDTGKYDLDFSDFKTPELIFSGKKYKAWPILEKVNEEKLGTIFILTARTYHVRMAIFKLLKENGIKIKYDNVITFGDDAGEISIANEKRNILEKIANSFQEVKFYDDNIDNINIAKTIYGVTAILVK